MNITKANMSDGFSEAQDQFLTDASVICSSFSFIATLCIIITSVKFPVLRNSAAFVIVSYLAISDCFYAFNALFQGGDGAGCKFQGFFNQLFAMSSL